MDEFLLLSLLIRDDDLLSSVGMKQDAAAGVFLEIGSGDLPTVDQSQGEAVGEHGPKFLN